MQAVIVPSGSPPRLANVTTEVIIDQVHARNRARRPYARAFPGMATAQNPLEEGQTFGPYVLLRQLGAGGQGVVHLAEDTRLKRQVALKVMGHGPVSDDRLKRFQREAEAASRLEHPNICGIHETGEVDGRPYIAMRFIPGETLAERITRWRFGEEDAAAVEGQSAPDAGPSTRDGMFAVCRLIEKVALALHRAHEHGLIHRDVKPGNVMVTPDGEPVVLDFGLARDELAVDLSLTQSGDLLGTPSYMSPEQLMAQRIPLDRRTDVYSLGATLYECLTLRRPFEATTRAALYQRILGDPPSRATSHNRQIPRDLEVVIETALEKNRDRRYQTAEDLAEDLRRVRSFEPIRARPIGRLLRLRRWAQRHPALATGGVLVNLGLAVALVFVALLVSSRADERSARALAEANERTAQDILAAAFLEKADRAIADGDHGGAAIFAAAALVNDPNNPNGPHYRPPASPDPTAEERIALMYSRHYEAEAGRRLTFVRGLPLPSSLHTTGRFAFSPAQPEIAVSAQEGSVCLFDLDRDTAPVVLAPPRPARGQGELCYSTDGNLLAATTAEDVQLWDVRARELRAIVHVTTPSAVEFLDADRLAVGTRTGWVRIWSLRDSEFVAEHDFGVQIGDLAYSGAVDRLAVVPGGVPQGKVWIVDDTLQGITELAIPHAAVDAEFSEDGGELLLAGVDNTLWSFAVPAGTRRGIALDEQPMSVSFSPDGGLIAHGAMFSAAVLRAASDRRIVDLANGRRQGQQLVGFARNGRILATSGSGKDVQLWRVGESRLRAQLPESRAVIMEFALSQDGSDIVTSSYGDGELRHWTVPADGDFAHASMEILRPANAPGVRGYRMTLVPGGEVLRPRRSHRQRGATESRWWPGARPAPVDERQAVIRCLELML